MPRLPTETKIVIATHGSRGDTQPMVALTIELQNLGYNVTLSGLGDQKEFAERYIRLNNYKQENNEFEKLWGERF